MKNANIQGNTIYINPDAPKERLQSRLLLHEAGHALLRGKDGKNLIAEAFKHIAPERSQEIAQRYINFYKKQGMSMEQYMPIVNEEITTAYIEDVLGDANAWEYILSEEPSFADKVLSFFRRSAREYSSIQGLSAQARKFVRQYKALFESLSERNQGNNALSMALVEDSGAKKMPVTNTETDSVHVTGDNDEKAPVVTNTDVDTDTRYAIKFLREEDLPGYLRAGGRTNKYKQQAIDNGKKIILTTPDEIREYIEKAINGEKDLPTVAYGKVDIKLSEETSDYSDGSIKIANYYMELVATDIRHAYQEHLHAKEEGDIDLSIKDFMNIPLYVATYDDFVYAIKYKSGNTKICLSKKIGDGRVLVIETVSKSHGSIEFKNMIGVSEEKYLEEYEKRYKKRNGTNTGGSESSNNSPRDETASSVIIPETAEKINPSDEISSEKIFDERYALPETNSEEKGTDQDRYSYDTLIKKDDLSVVTLPDEVPLTKDGVYDNKAIVARGRINARKQNNPNNTDERTYVHVGDIGLDVLLSKKGMVHGIARSQETALAVMKIGDILKNSVAVNELNGSTKRKTEMSYVLLGACRDRDNLYVVRSVISNLENDVTEFDVYQLSAVKGKKTETPTSALGGTGVKEPKALVSSESPTVSIADFLQYVKSVPIANEIFSEDVAKKLGVERSRGTLSEDLRYALPDDPSDTVKVSKGSLQKTKANYTSDKVYSKQDVIATLRGIKEFNYMPTEIKNDFISLMNDKTYLFNINLKNSNIF